MFQGERRDKKRKPKLKKTQKSPEKKINPPKSKKKVEKNEEKRVNSQYVYRSIEEEASAVLPIDRYIPSHLNKEAVKAIIIWGFLHPGEVKLFFGGHYLHYEAVRKTVLKKGVKPEDFDKGFRWLIRGGIILDAKPGNSGRLLCSLNPDSHSLKSPFQEILRIVIKAAQRR